LVLVAIGSGWIASLALTQDPAESLAERMQKMQVGPSGQVLSGDENAANANSVQGAVDGGNAAARSSNAMAFPDPNLVRRSLISTSSNAEMLISAAILPTGQQQIVLVDLPKKTLATYAIDAMSGQITLKSVRRFDGDFALESFNSSEPTPDQIRSMLPNP
jgi:hypothetical protein